MGGVGDFIGDLAEKSISPFKNLFGGSKADIDWTQSPEQRQMYQLLYPFISQMIGKSTSGQSLYNIPSVQNLMPTKEWWNQLSPEVMGGLWSPYNEGAKQMMETMGAGGQLGSAVGGYSGAGETALGRYYQDAAKNVGLQAWGMTYPGLSADYSAQLQQSMLPYSLLPGMFGGTYSTPVVSQGGNGLSSMLPLLMLGMK